MNARAAAVDAKRPIATRGEGEATPLGNRPGVAIIDLPLIPAEMGIRLSATTSEWNTDFYSPSHRHTFDQIRYVSSGRSKIGVQEAGPGDIAYIPEGAFYGPQTIIGSDPVKKYDIQIPGPTKQFYPIFSAQHAASAELRKTGTMEKGKYIRDGESIDSFEAIVRHITGSIPEYATPRVKQAIVFNTGATEWRPAPGHDGVHVKFVACITEVGPNIKLVKLDEGAVFPGSVGSWDEVRFVVEGGVTYEGEAYPAPSGFFFPEDAAIPPMRGSPGGAVLMCVQVARHWSKALPFMTV